MVLLSKVRPLFNSQIGAIAKNAVLSRYMAGGHHRTIPYVPSRWQWNKFKDYLHFYVMLGAIPLSLITLYVNVFIGPATLSEIPEGYVPKHWEYFRHPITRFLAKYILNPPQQDYEKYLHHLYEEEERRRLRKLEKEIKAKIAERNDYKAYYYRPVTAKYHRVTKETAEELETIYGD